MFGLQFSWKRLRIYPRERYVLSFVQALVTTAMVSLGTWLLIPVLFPEASASGALRVALAVGICAGPTAPSSIHYFSRLFKIRGRVNRLLKFIVGVDGIPAVFLVGLFAAFFRSGSVGLGEGLPGWKWLVLSTGIDVLLGAALTALVELEFSRSELLIFVLGLVAVASGLAQALELSAVYMSFCMGVTTANLAWHREEVHKLTAHAEKPLYLAFLVLAGTFLTLDDPRVFTLAVLLVTLRMTGKLLGNLWWRRASSEPMARSPLLGLSLISQGAFAVVLAVDFSYLLGLNGTYADWIQLVISALLVSVLMTEVMR